MKCLRDGRCTPGDACRICQLIDTEHPDYDPAYHRAVEGPSFWRRIGNASRAAVRLIAGGFGVVDDETRDARLAKCGACPINVDGVCVHEDCGCFLALKTRIASESCPAGEWDAVPDAPQAECGGCR